MSNLNEDHIQGVVMAAIITEALKAGYGITIDDGSSVITPKQDLPSILAAMCSTEYGDTLNFIHDGAYIGELRLIYENGVDLVSDYTDDPRIETIVNYTAAIIDTLT